MNLFYNTYHLQREQAPKYVCISYSILLREMVEVLAVTDDRLFWHVNGYMDAKS